MGTAVLLYLSGGGKRDRTADLLHAMQALSQLSYTPTQGRGLYHRQGPSRRALMSERTSICLSPCFMCTTISPSSDSRA